MHLNLAYRWLCRLDLTDRIPDHSTFPKNRHGRFRDSEGLRYLFETTVARCIEEGFASGQRMAVDASQWTAARNGPAFFRYSDNYLIDTDLGVILDVEPTRSIRQAEVGSTKTMLTRVKDKFGLVPDWMIADTAYGSGPIVL